MKSFYFYVPSENEVTTNVALSLAAEFSPEQGELNVVQNSDYVSLFLSTDSIAVAARFKLSLAAFSVE